MEPDLTIEYFCENKRMVCSRTKTEVIPDSHV